MKLALRVHLSQDYMAHAKQLEDRLLALNTEECGLRAEAAKMPGGTAGRTIAERRRRAEVEARMEAIAAEASAVRLHLRRLGVS
jgi:hypothetical protein